LYAPGGTFHNHYFEAGVVIEVRVRCRNDEFVMIVLDIGQLFRQQPRVMIVDESDAADDRLLWGFR
jgi:hypothetical protein